MEGYIFACFSKKQYYYTEHEKDPLHLSFFWHLACARLLPRTTRCTPSLFIVLPGMFNGLMPTIKVILKFWCLGDSPILEELKAMAQAKKVGDRAIKVTKIKSPAEIRKCNMLFVPAAKSGRD